MLLRNDSVRPCQGGRLSARCTELRRFLFDRLLKGLQDLFILVVKVILVVSFEIVHVSLFLMRLQLALFSDHLLDDFDLIRLVHIRIEVDRAHDLPLRWRRVMAEFARCLRARACLESLR